MPGFTGWLDTPAGRVARIGSTLRLRDHFGAWKARWGIGRMSYLVPPGLYAIGEPRPEDPVVVTANYKMSFDIVRQALAGRRLWLLVLETHGINVWCAAGKGTFGTDELVGRIQATRLPEVVNHRRLILPVLGAPGVAAHLVKAQTGFTVRYATARAADLPTYLDAGMVASAQMREPTFTFRERLVLIPVELVGAIPLVLAISVVLFLAAAFGTGVFTPSAGWTAVTAFFGAVAAGVVATPLLLPWLPSRSFAVKGAFAGLIWSFLLYLLLDGASWDSTTTLAAFFCIPAVSAFYALNFTGCTPFTSISGVKKEMRISIPAMAAAVAVGALSWLTDTVIKLLS